MSVPLENGDVEAETSSLGCVGTSREAMPTTAAAAVAVSDTGREACL